MKHDAEQPHAKDSGDGSDMGNAASSAAEISTSRPYTSIWQGLVSGDPGPFVAMFDSLLNGDFPYAAGGLLRDIADRIIDADDFVECDDERKVFVETAKMAILACEQGDETALQKLLAEAEAD